MIDIKAQMDAAWAAELEISPVLRAYVAKFGKETMYDVWANGYAVGLSNGLTFVEELHV